MIIMFRQLIDSYEIHSKIIEFNALVQGNVRETQKKPVFKSNKPKSKPKPKFNKQNNIEKISLNKQFTQ